MSDPITLDLYAIHRDAAQLAKLHQIQRERLAEYNIIGNDRPQGMRLSIADPVRRVKAALDPFWQIPFDNGVGARGHALEDYLEVALFHGEYAPLSGKAYESQQAIQWHEHGRSAFDFVVENVGGADRVVSCKSTIHGGKPSAANVAQERRMMALAGYPAESVFEVWVIDPGTFRAEGPYEYTLEQEHIDAARRELAGVDAAWRYFTRVSKGGESAANSVHWNNPMSWAELFGLESNSGAFRYTPKDASAAIEARVRAERRAVAQAKQAKADADALTERIYQFVDEQLAAAAAAGESVKGITAWSADEGAVTYGRKSNGAKQITVKPLEAAQNAA